MAHGIREVKYLLDTHAAFWLAIDSPKLGKRARRRLLAAHEGTVAISDMSLFELAMLDRRGTIELKPSASKFLKELGARIVVLPIDVDIAIDAAHVALPHGDPFDRLIVATARRHRLTLVTKDGHIEDAGVTPTLW